MQVARKLESVVSPLTSPLDDLELDIRVALSWFDSLYLVCVVVLLVARGISNRYAMIFVPGVHSDCIFRPRTGMVRGTAKIIMVLACWRL